MKIRKMLWAILLCLLVAAQLMPLLALGVSATEAVESVAEEDIPDGLSFSETGKYVQQKPLWGIPEDPETVVVGAGTSYEATKVKDNGIVSKAITFETMIYIPSTMAKNSITLFSNLWGEEDASETYLNTLSLEIAYTTRKGGGWFPSIRLSSVGKAAGTVSYRMTTGSKIPMDTWTHVALTLDAATTDANGNYKIQIYYNGSQKVTSSNLTVDGVTAGCDFGEANGLYNADKYLLGGTYVQSRDGHFGGYLKNFSVFNEARSAAEITEDYSKGFNLTDRESTANTYDADKMLCYYEFSRESVGKNALPDLSPMGNDLTLINGTEGISFSHKDFLVMDKSLSKVPLTFQARVSVPSKGKFYPILYGFDQYGNSICWGIQGRQVKLYYVYKIDGKGKQATALFDQSINYLPAGAWVDIAVTVDFENQQYKCYVNGELVQTLTPTGDDATLFTEAATADYLGATFVVGSNCAWGNTANYFQGRMSRLALYSDIRTDAEIFSDHQYGYATQDESIIAEYNLTTLVGAENIIDKTGNGHHLRSDTWMTEEEADIPTDYAYSFAVVGDTQFLSRYNVSGFEDNLDNLYKWILDNQERFKTQHVFGVGDIVESGEEATNNPSGINEWEKAYKAISQMDGKISYSLVRGKAHDDPTLFNQYMGTEAYYAMFEASEEYGFYEEGKINSSWRTFTVGQTDYLFLMLDYGIGGDLIPWAEQIIASHPNHRVIITTHKYLNTDGTLEGTGEAGFATFGKYDNVELVLCGHAGGEDIVYRQDMSPEGNLHTSMMINSQSMDKYYPAYGGFGMVAMLYFSEDGKTVTVRYYSTVLERYFRPGNQFTLTLDESESVTCDHTYDAQTGACSLCGIFHDGMSSLSETKLTIGDTLQIHFSMTLDPSVSKDAYIEIKNGDTLLERVNASDARAASLDTVHKFGIELPVESITDTITVQLTDGDRAGTLYTYSPAADTVKLAGATVSLGSTLSVNYYVSVLDGQVLKLGAPTMRFSVNGAALTVTAYTEVNGSYVFTLNGLAPQQMGDRIDATLLVGDYALLTHEDYSIKKNLVNLLSMNAAELGISEEKRTAMIPLISDLLLYGEAAQNYKDYATDAPVTEGVEGLMPSTAVPTEKDKMLLTGNTSSALYLKSATVHFDTANRIYVDILSDVEDASAVTVTVNGIDYALTDLETLDGNRYRFSTDDLLATQFADALAVKLSHQGNTVAEILYSVNAYAYAMSNGGTESIKMQALALSLYRYGQSAVAYVAAE